MEGNRKNEQGKALRSQHHSDVEWADFVRGLTAGPARASMKAHLSSGCRRCGRAAEAFGMVSAVARGEEAFGVPGHALRWATAVFSLRQPERVQILPRVLARLVFDSFGEPQPVGVRSLARVSRQAMYRAGDYYVDLRMESEPGTHRVSLVGQIAGSKAGRRSFGNVPVVLAAGTGILARAVSNEFGEFQMSYEPSRRLRLYVPLNGDRGIEVPLSRLTDSKTKRPAAKTDGRRLKRGR
jgi:hypothetical protein